MAELTHPLLTALTERLPSAILHDHLEMRHGYILGTGVSGSIISASYDGIECAAKPVLVSRIPTSEINQHIQEFTKLHTLQRVDLNLRTCINEGLCASWSTRQRLLFLRDLLAGIEYMHKEGVAHLDLKPENILVDIQADRITPLITDFGLSRFAPSGETVMSVLPGAGTPFYMPREQAVQGERVTMAADLFAFGLIASEVLIGSHPLMVKFRGDTGRAQDYVLREGHISIDVSSLQLSPEDSELYDPRVERDVLSALLGRCVSSKAAERPTATELYQCFDILTEFSRPLVEQTLQMKLTHQRVISQRTIEAREKQITELEQERRFQSQKISQLLSHIGLDEETRTRQLLLLSIITPEQYYKSAQDCFYSSKPVRKEDIIKGAVFLKEASDRGYPRAMFEWGVTLCVGLYFVRIDKQAGKALVVKAAEMGDPLAMTYCRSQRSWKLYTHTPAKLPGASTDFWARYLDNMEHMKAKDHQLHSLFVTAEAGHAMSQCTLADYLSSEDKKRAFELYQQAADRGYALAMHKLGYCYMQGWGVPVDGTASTDYLQRASKQGYDMYS